MPSPKPYYITKTYYIIKSYCITIKPYYVIKPYYITAKPPSQIRQLDIANATIRSSGFNSYLLYIKNIKKEGYFLIKLSINKALN